MFFFFFISFFLQFLEGAEEFDESDKRQNGKIDQPDIERHTHTQREIEIESLLTHWAGQRNKKTKSITWRFIDMKRFLLEKVYLFFLHDGPVLYCVCHPISQSMFALWVFTLLLYSLWFTSRVGVRKRRRKISINWFERTQQRSAQRRSSRSIIMSSQKQMNQMNESNDQEDEEDESFWVVLLFGWCPVVQPASSKITPVFLQGNQ